MSGSSSASGSRQNMSGAVRAAIEAAAADGRAALICYFPAGYPDLDTSEACLVAAAESGADVLEVGFPFSDPIMDGPVIQAAAQSALDQGYGVDDDLALCARLCAAVAVPAVAMTYYTIPSVRGPARFADDLADTGLSGAILPDLPAEEATDWISEARRRELATILLAAPTSSDARLDLIAAHASGFVYATSVLGVTGLRETVADVRDLVARVRERTDLPVCVGIGVSDAGQAGEVASYADGVIVGSALVRAAGDGDPGGAPSRVADLVKDLRRGVEKGRT